MSKITGAGVLVVGLILGTFVPSGGAEAITLCSGDCSSSLGPAIEYRVSSGDWVTGGEPAEGVTGSMRVRQVLPGAGDPISSDIDFEVESLLLMTGASLLSGSGELDAAAQGGVGSPRSLRLPNARAGAIVPGPSVPDPAELVYGFDAVGESIGPGVMRWTGLVLSPTAHSSGFWTGATPSMPDRVFLDLALVERVWEIDGSQLTFLGDTVIGAARLDLVAIPEPQTAFLLGLGLAVLALRSISRDQIA